MDLLKRVADVGVSALPSGPRLQHERFGPRRDVDPLALLLEDALPRLQRRRVVVGAAARPRPDVKPVGAAWLLDDEGDLAVVAIAELGRGIVEKAEPRRGISVASRDELLFRVSGDAPTVVTRRRRGGNTMWVSGRFHNGYLVVTRPPL